MVTAPPETLENINQWIIIITAVISFVVLIYTPIGKYLKKQFKKLVQKPDDELLNQITAIREELKDLKKDVGLNNEATLATLRDKLVYLSEKSISAGYISARQLDIITSLYGAYSALGGNSYVHELYEKVWLLPVMADQIECKGKTEK